MNNFFMRAGAGSEITSTIQRAKVEAGTVERVGKVARFDFNGVSVNVAADSDTELIYRDWQRSIQRDVPFEVGPYPSVVLSEAELAEDARVEAKNKAEQDARHQEWARKDAENKARLSIDLATAPPMAFSDEAGWVETRRVNTDGYGNAALSFAEDWARLMQKEIAQGKTVVECAQEAERLPASVHGLTGFQYGCAVSILAQTWVYGEELRRWHNHDAQLGTEGDEANESGGVLNPAVLRLG